MTEPRTGIVVTGVDWMGGGVGSVESAMRQLFQEAQREILLTVYSITSGADMLFTWLETALSRGVQIRMVVNRFDEKSATVRRQLGQLCKAYPYFHLYDFTSQEQVDLHAKLVVVDRHKAIVGSSNLSKRGLLSNYELALLVEGETATEIAQAIDLLISRLAGKSGKGSTILRLL